MRQEHSLGPEATSRFHAAAFFLAAPGFEVRGMNGSKSTGADPMEGGYRCISFQHVRGNLGKN